MQTPMPSSTVSPTFASCGVAARMLCGKFRPLKLNFVDFVDHSLLEELRLAASSTIGAPPDADDRSILTRNELVIVLVDQSS